MSYTVKEIYYTLQGEGYNIGRAAVFLRFAGCNLWSGREAERAKAVCQFCDTQFVGTDGPGGGCFASPEMLAQAVFRLWPTARSVTRPLVVCTGGEPLLQLDGPLIEAMHGSGFEVAVETNGTRPAPPGIDWLCVSPKMGADIVQQQGHELKLVYPQLGLDPSVFEAMHFSHLFLQPMDGPALRENLKLAAQYCLAHPRWRLSLQMHKLAGFP